MRLAAQDIAPANVFQKQKSGGKKIPAPTCRLYYYVGVQWCERGDGMGSGGMERDLNLQMHGRYRVQWRGEGGQGSIQCENN